MGGAAAPQRRCAGCGRTAAKSELLRLALSGRHSPSGAAIVVLDERCRMQGRGAYLCRESSGGGPSARCMELARKRGGIARALRCATKIEIADIVESVSR